MSLNHQLNPRIHKTYKPLELNDSLLDPNKQNSFKNLIHNMSHSNSIIISNSSKNLQGNRSFSQKYSFLLKFRLI
jgi:alkyl hydroperoxide reductase subunit AhpF